MISPAGDSLGLSVIFSLAGLEPGDRLGTTTGERGELLGGLVLIAVGIAIASGILEHPR